MLIFLAVLAASLLAGTFYSSLFEWTLHKFVMHRPFFGLRYPFRTHAQVHHRFFSWDRTYTLQRPEDATLVTFAWWNAPLLLGLNALAVGGAALAIAGGFTAFFWAIGAGAIGAMGVYYGLYEYLHWCMHVPAGRWFQDARWFRFIDDHHRMHHKNPRKNLNVVLPLADFLLRTRAPGLPAVSWMAAEARSRA